MKKTAFGTPLIWLIGAAVVAISAAGLGFYAQHKWHSSTELAPMNASLTWLPEPRPLPILALKDHTGASFSNAGLKDQWTLLFFGFTHCPDICPTTLYQLDQLQQQLPIAKSSAMQIALVSVDPERDTPERLNLYVSSFDSVVGLHASAQMLPIITRALGTAYFKVPQGDNMYTIDHSASIYLIDPNGDWAALASAPINWTQLQNEIASLISQPYSTQNS